MKHLLLIINKVVTYLASVVFAIWAIVSFIIYLVKDIPFNWLPVWLFIGISILGIAIGIYLVVLIAKEQKRAIESRPKNRKSNFQKRLEDLAKQRGVEIPTHEN